jgi:hypothetical protein
VAVLSDDGTQLLSWRINNDPGTFLALLGKIDGESKVALEATYGWEWLAGCSRRRAMSCTSRIRLGRARSLRPGLRPTPPTLARWRSCCEPICFSP